MKVALADKPAVPFRVPAGIKLIRIDPKSGMRAGPGDQRVILEAFKPGTAPPDNYSVDRRGRRRRSPARRFARGGPCRAHRHRRTLLTALIADTARQPTFSQVMVRTLIAPVSGSGDGGVER